MFGVVFKDPVHGEGKKESKTEQQDPNKRPSPGLSRGGHGQGKQWLRKHNVGSVGVPGL